MKMNKLSIIVIAFSLLASFGAQADSADDCWGNRSQLQKAIAAKSETLFSELARQWKDQGFLARIAKSHNPVVNNGRDPTFAEALASSVHRVCLKNWTSNLSEGFEKCIAWSKSAEGGKWRHRQAEVCGANFSLNTD